MPSTRRREQIERERDTRTPGKAYPGTLVIGYTDAGAECCQDATHEHGTALWTHDLWGRCSHGEHAKCPFQPGGERAGGTLTERNGLAYVLHCGCACHETGAVPHAFPEPPAVEFRDVARQTPAQRARAPKMTERRDERSNETRVIPRAFEREDGQSFVTPVVEHLTCESCGAQVPQRKEGRRRRYCDATCRKRAARAKPLPLPGM